MKNEKKGEKNKMVTITNGVKTFRVTAGSVKPYEGMGFHVVTDEELANMETEDHDQFDDDLEESVPTHEVGRGIKGKKEDNHDQSDDEVGNKEIAFIADLLEKPLSQWTNNEVKDFVRIKGIDTSGAQKVSQVREIIRLYLEEEQKNNA